MRRGRRGSRCRASAATSRRKGLVDDALHARLEAEVDAEVRAAIERAEARMQAARPLDMFDYVYGDVPAEVDAQREEFAREQDESRG